MGRRGIVSKPRQKEEAKTDIVEYLNSRSKKRDKKPFIIENRHLSTKELMEKTGCCASYINKVVGKANLDSTMEDKEGVDKAYREQVKKICKEQKRLQKEKEKHYKAQLKEEKKRLKALWGGVVKVIE